MDSAAGNHRSGREKLDFFLEAAYPARGHGLEGCRALPGEGCRFVACWESAVVVGLRTEIGIHRGGWRHEDEIETLPEDGASPQQ